MSKLDGRVNKLERTDTSREARREEMSEQDRSIIQQLSMVELSVCPDLDLVTEADTDPQTFKEIQRTVAEARGEFEPEPVLEAPHDAKSAPPPTAPRKRRAGRHREEDVDSMMEALDFLDQAVAESANARSRIDKAIDAARKRVANPNLTTISVSRHE